MRVSESCCRNYSRFEVNDSLEKFRTLAGVLSRNAAICAPISFLVAAYVLARPLADAPVIDSWLYARAVRHLMSGVLLIPGFTKAIPIAQIAYGALWCRMFGCNYVSLDISVLVLGAAGVMLFYALVRECGASPGAAALAASVLAANPCYLFLSFSFMTEVPFMALLIAGHAGFARAQRGATVRWLWISAAALVAAFMVRPFALAAIAGGILALILKEAAGRWQPPNARLLAPLVVAGLICGALWYWLTIVRVRPWMLALGEDRLSYVRLVPLLVSVRRGVVSPLLYLGLFLSPLAVPNLFASRRRLGLMITAALAAVLLSAGFFDPRFRSIPPLTCGGGLDNSLVLRAAPEIALWHGPVRWIILGVGILGAAGLAVALIEIHSPALGLVAVLITAAIYWCATIPLWMFNDRYYLVLVPAGCLVMAVSPRPRSTLAQAGSWALLTGLGWIAIAGVYDQHRGLTAIVAARDALLIEGVPRSAIDAGYPLNGNDLYRDPQPGQLETRELESGIPMITSAEIKQYAIARAPVPGTVVVKTFTWPGEFGFGERKLYVLKKRGPQ